MNGVRSKTAVGGLLLITLTAMGNGGKAPTAPSSLRLTALSQVETGQWELRDKQQGGRARSICLNDPVQLIQLRHPGRVCSRYVVTDVARHAVVTYQCSEVGQGRTDLRVETPRLVQIDTQGVADHAPFAANLEARRTGDCQ